MSAFSKRSVPALLMVAAAGIGCARHETSIHRQARAVTAAPAEAQWGPAAEGLQCRLRPGRRVCPAGESPTFRIDLCNHGGRVFAFPRGEQAPVHGFSIDGHWHRWPRGPATDGKARALGPDTEVLDLSAALPANARPLLGPGRHVVQFAFSFEGVEVVSNPVEIEIIESRQ